MKTRRGRLGGVQVTCLQGYVRCGTIQAAADELCLGYETVRTHLEEAKGAAGLRSLVQLGVWAQRQGLLEGVELVPRPVRRRARPDGAA